jgi:Protein of unknown function, DUF481
VTHTQSAGAVRGLVIGIVACLAVLLGAADVLAQSADDVAARVGTVARTMSVAATEPWSLDLGFAGDANRGNADTTSLRTTLVYVADSGAWRFGTYLTGAYDRSDGVRTNERVGLNLALARRLGVSLTLVGLEEIVHAPLDGLDSRNLLGGVAVWSPPKTDHWQLGVYGGGGWASERYTMPAPAANYGAALAGVNATTTISPTASLAMVTSYTQDTTDADRYRVGSSVALKAAVNSVLAVRLSYAVAYDHAPVGVAKRTNNTVSAGLTLTFKGK